MTTGTHASSGLPNRADHDPIGRAVLLRHDLPDGTSHFDWMLERGPHDLGRLMCFRVHERLDTVDTAAFVAERLDDHRREYLTYEGEVSRGRGRVERVAEGRCVVRVEAHRSVVIDQTWGGPWHRLAGEPLDDTNWRFLSSRLS